MLRARPRVGRPSDGVIRRIPVAEPAADRSHSASVGKRYVAPVVRLSYDTMPAHHGSATARRPNPPSPTRTRDTHPPSPRSGSSARTSPPSRGTPRAIPEDVAGLRARVGSGQRRQTELGQRPEHAVGELRQITPRTPPGSCCSRSTARTRPPPPRWPLEAAAAPPLRLGQVLGPEARAPGL